MPDFMQLPGTVHELTPAEASRTSSLGALSDEQGRETVEVTLLLRENPARPTLPETIEAISAEPVGWRLHLTHDELAAAHGCTAEDVELVSDWARRAGLTVGATDPAARQVRACAARWPRWRPPSGWSSSASPPRRPAEPPSPTGTTGPQPDPGHPGGDRRARRRPQ